MDRPCLIRKVTRSCETIFMADIFNLKRMTSARNFRITVTRISKPQLKRNFEVLQTHFQSNMQKTWNYYFSDFSKNSFLEISKKNNKFFPLFNRLLEFSRKTWNSFLRKFQWKLVNNVLLRCGFHWKENLRNEWRELAKNVYIIVHWSIVNWRILSAFAFS